MTTDSGTLFIVATPIGNLEDVTFRAINVLKEVDLVAAEDTRKTRILFTKYGISRPLTSYHDHNKTRQAEKILRQLLAGRSVALVSDAGTPSISDPGYFLINLAIHHHIPVVPVPGVSAVIAGLSVSGLPSDRFCFEGFLPRKPGVRRQRILALKDEERTVIFYESPYRITAMLHDFFDLCGERWIVVARELTKVYEEVVRGPLSTLLQEMGEHRTRGEFTVMVASARHSEKLLSSGSK
jgi:16S rRNA (cytidine1402-2'-O)-methyltransferase